MSSEGLLQHHLTAVSQVNCSTWLVLWRRNSCHRRLSVSVEQKQARVGWEQVLQETNRGFQSGGRAWGGKWGLDALLPQNTNNQPYIEKRYCRWPWLTSKVISAIQHFIRNHSMQLIRYFDRKWEIIMCVIITVRRIPCRRNVYCSAVCLLIHPSVCRIFLVLQFVSKWPNGSTWFTNRSYRWPTLQCVIMWFAPEDIFPTTYLNQRICFLAPFRSFPELDHSVLLNWRKSSESTIKKIYYIHIHSLSYKPDINRLYIKMK